MQTIANAMERVFELKDHADLMDYLEREYDFWQPTNENVKVEFYCRDDRIDWDTYLVTVNGKAALFTDGPISAAGRAGV